MDKFMGPWTWENDEETLDFFNVVNAEGGVVAMVPKGPTEEIRDRQYDMARAISALPELIEKARMVCKLFGTDHPQGIVDLKDAVNDLRIAITKTY